MSRLGKQPIEIPAGVEVTLNSDTITVKGPKGELHQQLHPSIKVEVSEQENGKSIVVSISDKKDKSGPALWGLFRQLINNLVVGVTDGFSRQLEVNGVGYRAAAAGNVLTLNLGYSHPVDFTLPAGIEAKVEKNVITISGIDKQLVGEVSAQVRKKRKPEPYKGKGIKYVDEVIRRKAGKTAASGS